MDMIKIMYRLHIMEGESGELEQGMRWEIGRGQVGWVLWGSDGELSEDKMIHAGIGQY